MTKTTLALHTLNTLIGCLSVTILGLVAHSVALKDGFEEPMPTNVKTTGMSLLFWPACGGIVDVLLIFVVWAIAPSHNSLMKVNARYLNWLLFFACFIFARTLIVLIYVFVEWNSSFAGGTIRASEIVSIEAWVCTSTTASGSPGAFALCAELKVARYLLIPILITSAVLWPLLLRESINLAKKKSSEKATQEASEEHI